MIPDVASYEETTSIEYSSIAGRAALNSAQAKVSPGPNVRRNGMFQVPLWAAEAIRSMGSGHIANMLENL